MAGTMIGGQRAATTNKVKHGEDFYRKIGKIGGQNGHTGGFAANRKLASIAGSVGGSRSRKGYKYTGKVNGKNTWVEVET